MDEIEEAMREAIKLHQGIILEVGSSIGHPSDEIIYKLIRYDADHAVVELEDGSEKSFPASEIFDVNIVRNTAVEVYEKRALEKIRKSKLN